TDDGSFGHAAAKRGVKSANGTFRVPLIDQPLFEIVVGLSIFPASGRIGLQLRSRLGTGATSLMAGVKKAKPDLTKKVHEVPHKPGVYLMRDRFNRVIHVGKARGLRTRGGCYITASEGTGH